MRVSASSSSSRGDGVPWRPSDGGLLLTEKLFLERVDGVGEL